MVQEDPAGAGEEAWGFCDKSCEVTELSPSIYHEQADVDVLSPERCSQ